MLIVLISLNLCHMNFVLRFEAQKNDCTPVIALPSMSEWMSCVPSYVFTVSRFCACLMTWYSSTRPFPPIMSLAYLAMSRAFPQLLRFTMEIISGARRSSSFNLATLCTACRPKVISVSISAIFFCCSCIPANGLPNWCLSSW